MKKIFAVNGSPRKNGNTAQLLKKALEGAASVGAEVKLIQLTDLNFSGCRSCFACKKLANPSPGCVLKDDLAEILKELLQADGIIMGSPIYFGAESGLYRNFLERLFFPMLRYTNPPSSRAEKRIDFGFIYTMNVPAVENQSGSLALGLQICVVTVLTHKIFRNIHRVDKSEIDSFFCP